MKFNPAVHPILRPAKVEYFTGKPRLREGWTIERLARDLRRESELWVCRSHPLDWKRLQREQVLHLESGMLIKFQRNRQEMVYEGRVRAVNLRILNITTIDVATRKVQEMNWPAASRLVNLLFGADAPWVWCNKSDKPGELPRWDWCCFYDEQWNVTAAPSTSMTAGSQYWSMHEHNKQGEIDGRE